MVQNTGIDTFMADAIINAPICCLESLPNDAIEAILSECLSFEDLHAFIRASPVVLRCFQVTRRSILISILSGSLGSSIRDAVAVALTPQLDRGEEGFDGKVSNAIDDYLNLPAGLESTKGLKLYNVFYLVNLNRTVQFWVNEYFAPRANVFKEHCEGTIKPLSRTERHRLAQAFIRYQLFMRLELEALMDSPKGRPLLQTFMAQYETWELHQVDAVDQLFKEVVKHSNSLPYRRPLKRGGSALQAARLLQWRRQKEQIRVDYLRDIAILRYHEMDYQQTAIREEARSREDWRSVDRYNAWDLVGTTPRFDRSYLYINYIDGSRPGMCWGYLTSGFAAYPSVADPPPGWVDALDDSNGHICWGGDSSHDEREVNGLLPGDTGRTVLPFFRWQLLGFVFWDTDRVMQIKEAIVHRYQSDAHM